MPWRWTRAAGSSSAIAATIACRSSTRTGDSSQCGSSSAAPSGCFIDRNDALYVADHQSYSTTNPGFRIGITIGSARDGKVTAFIPDPDGDAGSQEGVAVDVNGTIYGSLTGGMALKKYVKR